MRNRLPMFKLVAACLLGAIACSYTPPKPASQQPEDYPFRDSKAGITVGVNPYVSEEQLKNALSNAGDYLNNNVLPVQILIRNDGADELLFRIANVRLVWVDGSPRNVLTTPETFEAIKGSVAGGAIMMGVIGAAAVSSQNESKMKDLMVVSLKDSNVTPRSAIVGFVFFPLKKGDTSLKGTKLQMVLQNPSNLTESISEIALEGELPKNLGSVAPKP